MKVTETETTAVEEEVEYVYCDECGDDCTDDYVITPKETCRSCADGPRYNSIKRFRAAVKSDDDERTRLGCVTFSLFAGLLFPALVGIMILAFVDGERGDAITIGFASIVGAILWGALALITFGVIPV